MKLTDHSRFCGAAILAFAVSACAHSSVAQSAPLNACAAARAAESDALVRVPFEIVGGRVYVEARVNGGGPYRFAVDTGASGMGRADASLTAALQLPVTGAEESSDGVTTNTVNTVHLNSVALGGLTRENLDVITRDYSGGIPREAAISGILGREFFGDGVLIIDFPTQALAFSRTGGLSAANEGALAYERAFRVPAKIGDLDVTANLDTGAAVALVLPKSVFDQVAASPLEAAGRARLTNGVLETGRATVHGPLTVGDASAVEVEARVAERYPEVLIGGHVLQHYLVAFDQRTSLVAVCAP